MPVVLGNWSSHARLEGQLGEYSDLLGGRSTFAKGGAPVQLERKDFLHFQKFGAHQWWTIVMEVLPSVSH